MRVIMMQIGLPVKTMWDERMNFGFCRSAAGGFYEEEQGWPAT